MRPTLGVFILIALTVYPAWRAYVLIFDIRSSLKQRLQDVMALSGKYVNSKREYHVLQKSLKSNLVFAGLFLSVSGICGLVLVLMGLGFIPLV